MHQHAHLSEIWTYPIKSCKGISHIKCDLDTFGLEYDRRWMIVDEAGKFFTQREYPQIALIEVRLSEEAIYLKAPQQAEICVLQNREPSEVMEVQVWEDTCVGVLEDQRLDTWLSDYLKIPCRLVRMLSPMEALVARGANEKDYLRQVDPDYAPAETWTSFTDGYPFLILSEASLMDLNQRLEQAVPMNRFRPNLVIAGTAPYEEDTWKKIRIGEIEFDLVKKCSRCLMPTINQETGEKGKEPLHTLAQYRKEGNQIKFGQNAIHQQRGSLKVGYAVEVLEHYD